MKRFFRLTALAVACILLALSLCSCRYIDEQREAQAFYNEDKTEIEFDGAVYKQMNIGSRYHPIMDVDGYYYDRPSYRVTEKDVPVLLSSVYGNSLYVNDRKTTLEASATYNMFVDAYDWEPTYFFREDIYDKVKQILVDGDMDHYYFDYYHYPTNSDDDSYKHVTELLDDELTAAFNKAISVPREEKIGYQSLPSDTDILIINACDADMLIEYSDHQYYIIRDGADFYAWDGNTSFPDNCLAKIYDGSAELFKKLFNEHFDAVTEEDLAWYFDDDYTDYGIDYGNGIAYSEDGEYL